LNLIQKGTIEVSSLPGSSKQNIVTPKQYWSLASVVASRPTNIFSVDDQSEKLRSLIYDAVRCRMLSDVPLGAFLSGGIDSSLVVSMMQSLSSKRVKTFTIGFNETAYNEAVFAKKIADLLGTEHTELYVSSEQARDIIPQLADIYDEPFADSSQIPTCLVAKLAAKDVTVALGGDGGDEIFAGYERYRMCDTAWRLVGWLPFPKRKAFAGMLRKFPDSSLRVLFGAVGAVFPERFRQIETGQKYIRGIEAASQPQFVDLYREFISHWTSKDSVVLGGAHPLHPLFTNPELYQVGANRIEQMQMIDIISYLPDDILVKVDRATMNYSLEARAPLLDHRIIEFVFSSSVNSGLRGGTGKAPLKKILESYIPRDSFERPKQGFGLPIGTWLRTELRDWAESLLSEDRLKNDGFFNVDLVRQRWLEHATGRQNWGYQLWDVLMFQAWLTKWHN
jgi:asparagine synthase (glutamine-hydrolysing)